MAARINMKKFAEYRKPISIALALCFAVLLLLELIFGGSEHKAVDTVMTLFFSAIAFFGIRWELRKGCNGRHVAYARRVCIMAMAIGCVVILFAIVHIIVAFTNSSFPFGIGAVIIAASLEAAEKYL